MRRSQYYRTSPLYGFEQSSYNELQINESDFTDSSAAMGEVFPYSNSPSSSRMSTGSPLFPTNAYSSMRLQDQLTTRTDFNQRRLSTGQLQTDNFPGYSSYTDGRYYEPIQQTITSDSPVYSEMDPSGSVYYDTDFSARRFRSMISISPNEAPFLHYIPPTDRNSPRILLWNAAMKRDRPIYGYIVPLTFHYPNTVHSNLSSLTLETSDADYCTHLGALWADSFPSYMYDHDNTMLTTVYPQFSADTNAQWIRCDIKLLLRSMLLRATTSNQNSWILQQSECEHRDWNDKFDILYPKRKLFISAWTNMIYRLRVVRIYEVQENDSMFNTLQMDTCRGGMINENYSPQKS